jgi:hypothetical protein
MPWSIYGKKDIALTILYLSCLRQINHLEAYQINRLEEEVFRFLRDPSNFELSFPQIETDYY